MRILKDKLKKKLLLKNQNKRMRLNKKPKNNLPKKLKILKNQNLKNKI